MLSLCVPAYSIICSSDGVLTTTAQMPAKQSAYDIFKKELWPYYIDKLRRPILL